MALLVCLLLFLAMTGQSSATYCLCKDGMGDASLQKTLDYACGAGADCTQILQNGACYQPNTVKAHCDYAVNSYFQKKGQISGSCDFSGTATTSANPPTTVASGCSYPSSPSNTGTTTSTPTSTPTTSTGTPATTPTTGTTTGTTPIFGGGTTSLGPTGTGLDSPSDAVALFRGTNFCFSFVIFFLTLSALLLI